MGRAGIRALVDTIRRIHGCAAQHVRTAHVREELEGAVVWEGDVELFKLTGHPMAERAYAWSHATKGPCRNFYAVLHVPPVNSASAAVRASIVAAQLCGQPCSAAHCTDKCRILPEHKGPHVCWRHRVIRSSAKTRRGSNRS